jgi:hypothetical protein
MCCVIADCTVSSTIFFISATIAVASMGSAVFSVFSVFFSSCFFFQLSCFLTPPVASATILATNVSTSDMDTMSYTTNADLG